jgi:hypothetical protein
MKGTINAPHSILHGRDCEVIEFNYNNDLHIVKIDGYPNPLPVHDKEVSIDWGDSLVNSINEIAKISGSNEPLLKICKNCKATKPVTQFPNRWTEYCDNCTPF